MTLSQEDRAKLLEQYLPKLNEIVSANADGIIQRKQISLHSYKNIPIADSFWESGDHSSRTWKFSMHSFAPLNLLMAVGAWGDVETLVRDWIKLYGEINPETLGQFPWHDHATALRLDCLSLMAAASDGPDFPDLAQQHATLLLREEFYSKHTNHGYDQALALVLASRVFSEFYDTSEWLKVGLDRLIDEMNFAFNHEGVHVENSPAYHVGMTANLVRARFVVETLGIDITFDFDGLLNKALLFTTWITGPDRRLALLGDSTVRGGHLPAELKNLSNYQHAEYVNSGGVQGQPAESNVAIYPHAGYAIYRSEWFPWRDHVHLVMKSGFLSQYHRQDDDLNILLQGYGEHWLIDSGLYNHNQTDPVRIYMRSALAHNVPYIRGVPAQRKLPDENTRPTLTLDKSGNENFAAVFQGTSWMYRGVRLKRTVIVEDRDTFQIIDSFKHSGKFPEVFIQFHVPTDKRITTSKNAARIVGRNKELIIRVASGEVEDCKIYSGMDHEFKSIFSQTTNVQKPSQVIVFGPIRDARVRFRMVFS